MSGLHPSDQSIWTSSSGSPAMQSGWGRRAAILELLSAAEMIIFPLALHFKGNIGSEHIVQQIINVLPKFGRSYFSGHLRSPPSIGPETRTYILCCCVRTVKNGLAPTMMWGRGQFCVDCRDAQEPVRIQCCFSCCPRVFIKAVALVAAARA